MYCTIATTCASVVYAYKTNIFVYLNNEHSISCIAAHSEINVHSDWPAGSHHGYSGFVQSGHHLALIVFTYVILTQVCDTSILLFLSIDIRPVRFLLFDGLVV